MRNFKRMPLVPEGVHRLGMPSRPMTLPSFKTPPKRRFVSKHYRHKISSLHSAETDMLRYGQALAKMRNDHPFYAMTSSLYRSAQSRAAELAARTGAR